uniref:Uncharacterized protein n=1 Tax=Amphimedon queenslandica TaxID=400682 RepID=A0A1X7UY99_AMPQE
MIPVNCKKILIFITMLVR